MGVRECPFCGKKISDAFRDCPHCHETLPELRVVKSSSSSGKGGPLRRGLLYMMIVAFIYYFLSSNSPLKLPTVPFAPLLTTYLLPLFFLASLGITMYGIFLQVKG
jgi:hypothetical protein